MKKTELISNENEKSKKFLIDILKKMIDATSRLEMGEYTKILQNLLKNIDEPFLFVIVGEVKSGKSSFINALLRDNICLVDPAPCTDTVQQIVFSDEFYEETIEEHLKKIGVNSEVLKKFSIVDTPGTNSIIQEHQLITEEFVPNSDLIVFVFPAINPYQGTAWEMLHYMKKEWEKKIVFILQQADRCSEEDLEIHSAKIKEYAIERGISAPKVFVTSAKQELEGLTEKSGMESVRAYIRDNITGGNQFLLKLRDKMNFSDKMLTKIKDRAGEYQKQLAKDIGMRDEINTKFESGRKRSEKEIDSLVDRMMNSYRVIAEKYKDSINEIYSVSNLAKQILPFVSKKKVSKETIEVVCGNFALDLKTSFEKETSENTLHFMEGIKQVFENILRELDKNIATEENNFSVYDKFYARRDDILNTVKEKLNTFSNRDNLINILQKDTPDMTKVSAGGGIAVIIGGLLTYSTQLSLLDITGGLIAALGIASVVGFTLIKSSDIRKKFSRELDSIGEHLEIELREKFISRLGMIFEEIDRIFESFDNHIEISRTKIEPILEDIDSVKEQMLKLRNIIVNC